MTRETGETDRLEVLDLAVGTELIEHHQGTLIFLHTGQRQSAIVVGVLTEVLEGTTVVTGSHTLQTELVLGSRLGLLVEAIDEGSIDEVIDTRDDEGQGIDTALHPRALVDS